VTDTADGLFIMQTAGPSPFLISTAYLAPIGAAIGGAAFDGVNGTVFAAVRHPGATPSASFSFPATRWPTLAPNMPPQTTLIGLVRGA
jgi:secreted PhoX family phosphatase